MNTLSKKDFLYHHWNYYIMLEKRVVELEEYIAFNEDNKSCYSKQIMNILINVCCEFDVICKLIIDMDLNDFGKINVYRQAISQDDNYKIAISEELDFIEFSELHLIPLKNFETESPDWWKAYNDLKHNREENFSKATLFNLLNALGALYILEIYFYKNNYQNKENDENIPSKTSILFTTKELKPNFIHGLDFSIIEEFEFDDEEDGNKNEDEE